MKNNIALIFIFFSLNFVFAQINQVDAKGRKQGVWEKKYPNLNTYQYKGQFKDDKPVGTFIYYSEENKLKAIIKHTPNSKRSEAVYYHDNGKVMSIGIFINQLKDSTWKNFGPSERISSIENYKAGKLHGKRIVYYIPQTLEDKSLIKSIESNYVNGELDGLYQEFFDIGGIKISGKYILGKKTGEWIHNNPNGTKMMFERYKNGVYHGWQHGYDENGKELGKKYYFNGKYLQGKELDAKLKYLKDNGLDPNK